MSRKDLGVSRKELCVSGKDFAWLERNSAWAEEELCANIDTEVDDKSETDTTSLKPIREEASRR